MYRAASIHNVVVWAPHDGAGRPGPLAGKALGLYQRRAGTGARGLSRRPAGWREGETKEGPPKGDNDATTPFGDDASTMGPGIMRHESGLLPSPGSPGNSFRHLGGARTTPLLQPGRPGERARSMPVCPEVQGHLSLDPCPLPRNFPQSFSVPAGRSSQFKHNPKANTTTTPTSETPHRRRDHSRTPQNTHRSARS